MDEYQKIMDDALKAIETEKVISKTKPYMRACKDYEATLTRHQNAKNRASSTKQQYELKLNQVTGPKHCSLRKVNELMPIRLKDMLVNNVHTDKYLMCRIVGEPFYLTGIIMVVEDESGDIENVSLYNYTTSYEIDPLDLLPLNTVIIIKEPYLKIMISNNSDYYIRVESPTDVVVVDDHGVEKWKPIKSNLTYEQLNELGNKCFVKKEYRKAIRYYTQALDIDKNAKTYSNRAAAELELEMFIEAFRDAHESARIEASEKAYYRMARAAYAMRQYSLAAENFTNCVKLNEKNKKASEDLERCEKRLKEACTGIYDMKKLISDVKSGLLRLDVGDYVSKSIAVKDVANKSKGIVAIEKIKRGTLLVASKAASIAYDSECSKFKVISVNFYTKKMDQPSNNQNLVNLFYKLQHDPYLAEKLYELYPGEGVDRSQKIPEGIVDSCRTELILTYNSFITQDQKDFVSGARSSNVEGMEENSGIWIFPSYFNHSCVPNTIRIYLKDFVMFYAFKDIEVNEELTIQYCGLSSFSEREKICSHFGFKCMCRLCEMDRADANFNNRETLLAKNQQILKNLVTTDEKYILKYVQMVKNTYRDGQEFQYRMSLPMATLAGFYRMKGDLKKAAQTFMQMFEILKDCDSIFSSMVLIQALNCYLQEGMLKEASQILKIAKNYFVGSVDYYNYVYDINNFCLP